MPFPKQDPRPFTKAQVEALKPNHAGVYGLLRGNAWVYVGRGDIRDRLLAHLNGDNACITRQAPTHWVDVLTDDRVIREKELIAELEPTCNEKIG